MTAVITLLTVLTLSVIASLLLTDKRNKKRSAIAEKHSSVVSTCDDKAMGPFTDLT